MNEISSPGRRSALAAGIGSLALLAAWLISSVILISATALKRFLGKRGLIAMERLMGMLLIAVAVQMLLEGIAAYL